jgi:hypothetical protein
MAPKQKGTPPPGLSAAEREIERLLGSSLEDTALGSLLADTDETRRIV